MPEKQSYKDLERHIQELECIERDHRKVEEQIRDEITWWRIMIEQSRDGIVIFDQDGNVYEANRRFADMLGYSMDEINQLHVWDWDAHYTKEQLIEVAQAVDETGAHIATQHRRKDGSLIDVELSNNGAVYHGRNLIFCVCRDTTERNRAEQDLTDLIEKLKKALDEIKTLRGILSICSHCKKIRDENGEWVTLEDYLHDHSEATLSHGVCPDCSKKHYPEIF